MNTTLISTLETSVSILTIHENGVGHTHFKDNITMEIPEQLEHLKALIVLTNGHPTPFIVTIGKRVAISHEARENSILIEEQAPTNAVALIVLNLGYRLVVDFYLKINKPKTPYKVFTDKEKAIEWCLQFVVKKD